MTARALKQFNVPERAKPASFFRAAWTLVSAELILNGRDTRLPVLLALCAGLCLLLTPPGNASYAILTFGGLKPVMSAGTRLITAGIVLELLLFPFLLLRLGVGHARDQRLGTAHFVASCPLDRSSVVAARIFANAMLVFGFCALLLVLLSTAVALREKQAPAVLAMAAFLLITIPSALLSLPLGAALDRWLGGNRLLQTAIAAAVYALLITSAVFDQADTFGLRLLKENWPPSVSSASFSIGLVSAPEGPGISWNIEAIPLAFVCRQGLLVLVAILAVATVSWLARFQLNGKDMPLQRGESPPDSAPTFHPDLVRLKPRRITYVQGALVLAGRWFTRSAWTGITAVAALLLSAMYPHAMRTGPVAALLIPLLIANRGHLTAESSHRDLELSSPALWRPTPTLFTSIVLASITALAALPGLLASPVLACLQLLVGMLASCLWLTWTCAQLNRPLLGISIYALFWYLESFSGLPPALDLLGLRGTNGPAFGITAAACLVLAIACVRRDQATSRRSTFFGEALETSLRRAG
jgi:hypothetical protein